MPRLSPLPKTLRYLQPFRRQVAKLSPEEIHESMDLSLLNKLMLARIEGMPADEGKKILQEDQAILIQWLETPELEDNGGMMFLLGYWMALPGLVDHLLEEKEKLAEEDEVQMEFPLEAKAKCLGGERGWKASWRGSTFFIYPIDKKHMQSQVDRIRKSESSPHPVIRRTMMPVSFGLVKGFKSLVDASIVESMEANYLLEAPGGHVEASLLKSGNRIDASKFKIYETTFEQILHTIKVVRIRKY